MTANYTINPPTIHRASWPERMESFAISGEGLWRVGDTWFVNYPPRQAGGFIIESLFILGQVEGRDSFLH